MERRRFLAAGTATVVSATANPTNGGPALLGGKPVRTQPFSAWPVIADNDEAALRKVLLSGKWNRGRGSAIPRFEQLWAEKLGAKHCLATANGTASLMVALNGLGIGPGDEVIVPPYTFVATINAVLMQHALPIFVDSDIETLQIDANKIEAAITERTTCIIPVHIGGSAVNMDTVLSVARKRQIPVIEDACQAHLGEWRGKKLSTLGQLGCFSFQASKNLNSGEGGAVMTSDDALIERCRAFHNNGSGSNRTSFQYSGTGCNLRITEFQSALLTSQLERLDAQSKTRETNAAYLTSLLKEIPGITPARMYEGCTRNAYHLYMFRYDSGVFAGLPRARFLKALAAEGIPCSGGYAPLNREPFLRNTLEGRGWKRIYSDAEIRRWHERNETPNNDRLCSEAVWLTQTMLLGNKTDMDQIAEGIRKIQRHASALIA
jgi:dTDP-4-amino-4,6-dideoxygalactose transaminase